MISWFSGKKEEKTDTVSKKSEQIITMICNHLSILISRQLGEYITVPQDIIKQLKTQIHGLMQQEIDQSKKQLENNLIHVKDRYNYTISSLEQTKLIARQFNTKVGLSIQSFINVVSEALTSKQLQVPVKQIKRGLVQNSSQTVQKYFSLLGKLYVHEHGKALESSAQMQSEMRQNKSLQSQIILLREQKKLTQKKVQQLDSQKNNVIKSLTNKQQTLINKLNAQEASMLTVTNELKQAKKKIQDLQVRLKVEKQSEQSDKINKQSKQQRYLLSIKKLNQQKIESEDRYAQLQIQLNRLKNQNQQIISKATDNISVQLQLSKDNIKLLQHQINNFKTQIQALTNQKHLMVEKNVIKSMLEVYMDEGKQWAIKNQVQKQLVLLLDMKPKQEQKQENKGWFGWL